VAVTLWGSSPYQTISLGTIFNSMASTGLVTSGALTIPVLTGSSSLAFWGELVLEGTALVTTGAGSPNFQAVLIPETPGASYESAGVSNAQLFPYIGGAQEPLLPSLALTVIRIPFLTVWPIGNQKLAAYNGSGGALAASVTANLLIYGGSAG